MNWKEYREKLETAIEFMGKTLYYDHWNIIEKAYWTGYDQGKKDLETEILGEPLESTIEINEKSKDGTRIV